MSLWLTREELVKSAGLGIPVQPLIRQGARPGEVVSILRSWAADWAANPAVWHPGSHRVLPLVLAALLSLGGCANHDRELCDRLARDIAAVDECLVTEGCVVSPSDLYRRGEAAQLHADRCADLRSGAHT